MAFKKNPAPAYQDTLRSLKSNFGLTHSQAQTAYTKIRDRLDRTVTAGDISRASVSKAAARARGSGSIPLGGPIEPRGGFGGGGGASGGYVMSDREYADVTDMWNEFESDPWEDDEY